MGGRDGHPARPTGGGRRGTPDVASRHNGHPSDRTGERDHPGLGVPDSRRGDVRVHTCPLALGRSGLAVVGGVGLDGSGQAGR